MTCLTHKNISAYDDFLTNVFIDSVCILSPNKRNFHSNILLGILLGCGEKNPNQ